jgi:hypothetical protein
MELRLEITLSDIVDLYKKRPPYYSFARLHMSKTATRKDEKAKLIKYFNCYAGTNKSPEHCSAKIDALFDESVVFVYKNPIMV